MSGSDWTSHYSSTPVLDPAVARRASVVVADVAVDEHDCRELLEILGLIKEES